MKSGILHNQSNLSISSGMNTNCQIIDKNNNEITEKLVKRIEELEKINYNQEIQITQLNEINNSLKDRVHELETINGNLMKFINHSGVSNSTDADSPFITNPGNHGNDKYTELCTQSMQTEMEKLIREKEELSLQVEHAIACSTEVQAENELMKKFLKNYRARKDLQSSPQQKINDNGNNSLILKDSRKSCDESRRMSMVLDETMSVKSIDKSGNF